MGKLGEAHRAPLQPLGDVMRGGLAFERGVHRQHYLIDPARGDAGDEAVDRQILGPHPVQRGELAAQHMEAAGEQARALERPQVRHLLDHAELALVAAGIGADGAWVRGVDIAAGRTADAAPRAAPNAGQGRQARQGLGEGFDLGRGHASDVGNPFIQRKLGSCAATDARADGDPSFRWEDDCA
ncbi:hypothetical protein DdX_21674 [Ditylenchus destructor]|uniref:Uncharacterized protein n=1 Tax=Ditylenchus destructor TaxID=166010 RepID=A0AAD4QVH8_9BILA|nr:hypothetical protein DdX_21674 [Ditylenchus destructor]